jgi:sugar porter (SP) family MFS transporter
VACYQFCVTIGILLASCVVFATENRSDTGSYRIPIGIQFAWALILGIGLVFLPDSPRYFVKKGRIEDATLALCRIRGQPRESHYIEAELAEIIANEEYERAIIPQSGWLSSWHNCFKGGLRVQKSNLRRTILGTSLQMMQQWTGVNFIFYYSTPFLQSTGAISNTFLISLIFTLVNVCSTPISFWSVEKFGRRPLLIWGAFGMLICQFLVAIIGVTVGFNKTHLNEAGASIANNIPAVNAQIAFIAIYIFFFASTWGPGAWIVIGEIFPLPIRSRGVALSTSSNWLWNTVRSAFPSFSFYQTNRHPDHRRHHPLHGRPGPRRPEVLRLLRLGRSVYVRLRLRLLPRPRDQGSVPGAGRQDDGGVHPAHLGQMASPLHLCPGEGHGRAQGGICRGRGLSLLFVFCLSPSHPRCVEG